MNRNEFLVLRMLLFTTLLFFSYRFMFSFFTPLIAPEGFLDSFKLLNVIVTVIGLHAILALAAFIASRFNSKSSYGTFLIKLSWFTPLLYLVSKNEVIPSISVTTLTVVIAVISLLDQRFRTVRKNYLKKYKDLILYIEN